MALLAALLLALPSAQDVPKVLGPESNGLLHAALLAETRVLAETNDVRRKAATASMTAMRARQQSLRAAYRSLLGPMPARTALHTTVVGTVEAEGYRIERLHFQSRPHHHVTANLYVPDGDGPFPGVLVACGHSENGKAYESYQKACALLGTHGFVVLIYDPVGQGERHQLDIDRHGTTEHELLNVAGMLVGEPLVKHELWDGVRAIDVLLARPELGGATQVGLAGNSGGGTQTVFLAAWDERVAVATPACYVMQHQRLFETIGPQDGCQWLPGEGAAGLDHPDYLTLFAPRPMRVLAARRDFFDFEATGAAVSRASGAWSALGGPTRFGMTSTDQSHGWSRELREACASWMLRWLAQREVEVREPELTVFPDEVLQVTTTGQVRSEFEGERSVADLLRTRAQELRDARGGLTQDLVRAAIGPHQRFLLRHEHGERKWKGKWLAQFSLQGEGPPLPLVELVRHDSQGLTIILHDQGKLAEPELLLEAARRGRRVLAVDLLGYGELEDRGSEAKFRNPEHRTAMLALHAGRSLLGRRVGDVLSVLAATHPPLEDIELIGVGRAGVTALHVAYLWPRFERVELRGTITSWEQDVLADPALPDRLGNVVPGVLELYDLPDLERALGDVVLRRPR